MTPRQVATVHQSPPQLVTVEEAAELLSIGRSKVYELIARGLIRTVQIGRARRVPVSSLAEFVATLLTSADAATHPASTVRSTPGTRTHGNGSAA